jgi:hypothetical protein
MSFEGSLKGALRQFRGWLLKDTRQLLTTSHQLAGRMASWQVRSRTTLSSLADAEFKVSSQWGQDGIVDWLIERTHIPLGSQTFIEFGVEDYREANTRFLLQNRNWRGLIMDGSEAMAAAVREDGLYWAHDLTVKPAFITRENVNQLIADAGFRGEIGLLSIDVDGNDYWIWEAIDVVQPILCICEYNAVLGDVQPVSTPYDPAFQRSRAHTSNLYFGASIAALCSLARRKGYRFAGTNSAGNDAFFVREDYARGLFETSLRNVQALPSFFRESRDDSGSLSYVSGLDRLQRIASMPVVNVETGAMLKMGELDRVYSSEWLTAISHNP